MRISVDMIHTLVCKVNHLRGGLNAVSIYVQSQLFSHPVFLMHLVQGHDNMKKKMRHFFCIAILRNSFLNSELTLFVFIDKLDLHMRINCDARACTMQSAKLSRS